jgi:D-sedoheptulose 7-phosphate isomerase
MTKKVQNVLNFKQNIDNLVTVISSIKTDDLLKLNSFIKKHTNIIIIGNGGSNSIASHISVDFNKFLKKKTLAFTDSSMLTAYFNDYGNKNVYVQYLKQFVIESTLVIFISSSGNSVNILEAIKYCNKYNINYCLLTGFFKDNPCRKLAKKSKQCLFEFWVNSKIYGVVENSHQILLHSLVIN